MLTPSEPLTLLARAAELRAAGTPWEAAATQLALPHDELRRVVGENACGYERLARRAREEFRREASGAALATLRVLLTAPEQGVRLVAATAIVRYHVALLRHDQRQASDRLRYAAHRLENRAGRDKILPPGAQDPRAPDTSESTQVSLPPEVDAAKKCAQTAPPAVAPTAPVTAVPAVKPAGLAAAVFSGRHHLTLGALARRSAEETPEPPAPRKTRPPTLEVEGLMRSWLPE